MAAALVLTVLAIAWTQRLWIAEQGATIAMTAAGIDPVAVTVTRLDLEGATVTPILIGDGVQRIERLEISYTIGGLWNGRVDRVALRGIRIRANLGAEGLSVPGISLPAGSDGAPSASLPFRTVTLDDVRVQLDTAQGPVTLTTNGRAETPDNETVEVAGQFKVDSHHVNATGDIAATILGTGEIVGRVALRDGNGATQTVRLTGLRGGLQFIAMPDGAIDLDVNLTGAEAAIAGNVLSDLRASLGIRRAAADNGPVSVETLLESPLGRAETTGTVAFDGSGPVRIDTDLTIDIATGATRAALKGKLNGTLTPDGGGVAKLHIANGSLEHAGVAVSGLSGGADLSRTQDGNIAGGLDLAFRGFQAHGLTGEPGSLSARLDASEIAVRTALAWTDGTLSVSAKGPKRGPLRFDLAGTFGSVQPLARLVDGVDASGNTSFSVSGTLRDPLEAVAGQAVTIPALLDRIEARGWVDSGLVAIEVADMFSGGSVSGRLEVAAAADGIRLESSGLRLAVEAPAPALTGSIPTALRKRLTGPVRIAIEPRGERVSARVTRTDNGLAASVDAVMRASAGNDSLMLSGAFDGQMATNGDFVSLAVPKAHVDVTVNNIAGGTVAGRMTVTGLQAGRTGIRAAYEFDGTFAHAGDGTLTPFEANAALSGTVDSGNDNISLIAARGGRVSVSSLAVGETVRLDDALTISLTEPFRARFNAGRGLDSLSYATAADIGPTRLAVKSGEDWIGISLTAMPATFSGEGETHRVTVKGGDVAVPQHELRATGIDFGATLGNRTAATLAIDAISHLGDPVWFTPLRLTAGAKRTGKTLRFDARLFDPPEQVSVEIEGTHDLAIGHGTASILSQKLTFLPTVLQPAQLFPVLGRTLTEVDGSLEARARLDWTGSGLDSSLDLLVEAQALKADEFAVENVSAVIHFDSLMPLTTPPEQEVAIGLLDVGVPLANGVGVFELASDGRIHAALRELDFFGGRIDSEPFTMPKNFDGFTVPLRVNGVSLEQLLAVAKAGDLTATGTLNGSLPIVIRDATVAIRGGVLESAPGGGTIRYTPAGVGPALSEANEGTKLFLDIVKDFQYDNILVALDEDEFGEVAFRFKIEGRNNAVYNGVPIVLNVAMDGPLRKILGQGLKTYTLPENLLQRIEAFETPKNSESAPGAADSTTTPDSGEAGGDQAQ